MLELLLAKLGIPLEEAQRSFAGEGCERHRCKVPPPSLADPLALAAFVAAMLQMITWQCICLAGSPCFVPTCCTLNGTAADDMAPRYRNILQEKLELHAPAFRMTDITFKSFQLQVCRRWCRCRCRHKHTNVASACSRCLVCQLRPARPAELVPKSISGMCCACRMGSSGV